MWPATRFLRRSDKGAGKSLSQSPSKGSPLLRREKPADLGTSSLGIQEQPPDQFAVSVLLKFHPDPTAHEPPAFRGTAIE